MKKKKEDYFGKKERFEEFIWHILLGLFLLGIFILSSIEGSGERYWDFWMLIERKGAHIFEFFVLAYLFWKVLSFYILGLRLQIWLAFLFSLLCASWDEVHQLFVFGLRPDVTLVKVACQKPRAGIDDGVERGHGRGQKGNQ